MVWKTLLAMGLGAGVGGAYAAWAKAMNTG